MARPTKQLVATRTLKYGTRMLQAGDAFEAPLRDAQVLLAAKRAKLYAPRDPVQLPPPPASLVAKVSALDHDADGRPGGSIKPEGPDLSALRTQYADLYGKRPFMGWGEDKLREMIAAKA